MLAASPRGFSPVPHTGSGPAHLVLSHLDGPLLDDPGDRLAERRRGERARVGPVVPAGGQEAGGLEGAHGGPRTLRDQDHGRQVSGSGGGGGGGAGGRGTVPRLHPGDKAFTGGARSWDKDRKATAVTRGSGTTCPSSAGQGRPPFTYLQVPLPVTLAYLRGENVSFLETVVK